MFYDSLGFTLPVSTVVLCHFHCIIINKRWWG